VVMAGRRARARAGRARAPFIGEKEGGDRDWARQTEGPEGARTGARAAGGQTGGHGLVARAREDFAWGGEDRGAAVGGRSGVRPLALSAA
jgi:hypothetical protein